ncbi:MAG: aldo/keto reductase [Candidatus Heimdallarchaeota archaeon]|nr:aldo/keto reductase [Candidatus Heimdallarchaeota archaeon]
MSTILNNYLTLNNGTKMPVLGFGTANLGNKNNKLGAFNFALEAGYRHFDSASMYDNEKELGEVLKKSLSTYDRDDLFIATKLWNSDHGYKATKSAFHDSMKKLQLEYLDMYLIHWPVTDLRLDSWKAMEELVDEGYVGSIGVSNYTIRHLTELLEVANIKPVVNQVEFSPFLFQEELLEYCRQNKIILEAYSPILSVIRNKSDNEILNDLADKYEKSIAQISIKWSLQLGNSVIPRSSNKERIQENADIFDFDLTDSEIIKINSLNEELRLEWDPTDQP